MSDQKDLTTLLGELDALEQAATPGQWFSTDAPAVGLKFYVAACCDHTQPIVAECREIDPDSDRNNAVFIAAIRNAWPALKAGIEQLQRERNRLHRMVCDARQYIDPEQHADWEAEANTEASMCEQAIERLEHENERLRAERDQLSEIIDTWGFVWMEERENDSWHQGWRQAVRERDEARRECDEARARAIRWNNEHAAAEDRWVEERDALRAEVLQLRKNLLRTWAAAEVREYDLRKLVAQQREALLASLEWLTCDCPDEPVSGVTRHYGDECPIEKARAVLAQEVPS